MIARLPYPTLMLVTDRNRSATPLVSAICAAVEGGVDLVLVRETDLPDEDVGKLVLDLIPLIGRERILVNGRPELAGDLGIGLHLREDQQDIHPRVALPALVGRSTHTSSPSPEATRPDYFLAGNVFPTRTHPGRSARGVHWLTRVASGNAVPTFGIGGIDSANVVDVMSSGCHGVAVIDAILVTDDPCSSARQLRRALDGAMTSAPDLAGTDHRFRWNRPAVGTDHTEGR